jgi:histone deacetylase complex subunit SAP18
MTGQGMYPNQEVQIYTWPDATLRELCELLQGVVPNAGDYNARLDLSLVYLDKNGNYGMKQVPWRFVYSHLRVPIASP